MKISYKTFDHTADLGIEVQASTRGKLYAHTGLAMVDCIVTGYGAIDGTPQRIEVSGADAADLMVNWLREILYLWAGEEKVIGRIDIIAIAETTLVAEVAWKPFDPKRHRIRNEIKAVTYHGIQVAREADGFTARVIFDI